MADGIYVSLDEARDELKKRWEDVELRKRIEEELGDKFFFAFQKFPRVVLNRQVVSPDNGFMFFYQCAKYIGENPLVWEGLEDMFVSFNEEKKGLGRLRVTLEDGTKSTVDIMNFHENEKKKLSKCILKNGEILIDFHHDLCKLSGYNIEICDNTAWKRGMRDVSEYYHYTMLHFIAHGVLFENFFDEGGTSEDEFTHEVVYPAIKKIEEDFGVKPLIVRLYPENQTDEEDFYWWSYPPYINNYIVDYAKKNNMNFKKLNFLSVKK
ncbi:MAG: hypothetical protein Q8L10_04065 [Candidatus Moranbacteria bacterium]|nr:hypothetical protein [Candidatus Moranbacteria bacterium]